jgi:cytochrome c553
MKRFFKTTVLMATVVLLAVPFMVRGSEEDGISDKDVFTAEGTPPLTPHTIKSNDELLNCLSCHGEGTNGAPRTPHPRRTYCVQCHGQGEIKVQLDIPAANRKKK